MSILRRIGAGISDFAEAMTALPSHSALLAAPSPPIQPLPPQPPPPIPVPAPEIFLCPEAETLAQMIVALFDADDESMRMAPAGHVNNVPLRLCVALDEDRICRVIAWPEKGFEDNAQLTTLPIIELGDGADLAITKAHQAWLVRRCLAAWKKGLS